MVKIRLGSVDFTVNQTAINISKKSSPKVYRLASGAEIIVPCTDKLDTIEFSGFFYDTATYEAIVQMMHDGTEQNFVATGLTLPINLYVVVTDFVAVERGGDIGCIEYTIKLCEYVSQDMKIINWDSVSTSSSVTPETVSIPTTYTVVKGDNLWNICKTYLGDPYKYSEVALKNNISNPNLIYPGQVLTL